MLTTLIKMPKNLHHIDACRQFSSAYGGDSNCISQGLQTPAWYTHVGVCQDTI